MRSSSVCGACIVIGAAKQSYSVIVMDGAGRAGGLASWRFISSPGFHVSLIQKRKPGSERGHVVLLLCWHFC